MAVLLCAKYEFMKGPAESGHILTETRMIVCLKHLKSKQVEVHKENEALDAHTVLCKEMLGEVSVHDNRPNLKKLQSFLNQTRDIRIETQKKMTAALFFEKYAALKIKELLLWEFLKIVDVSVASLQNNLKDSVDHILQEHENISDELNYDGKSVGVLLEIKKFFKKVTSENQKVMEYFPPTTPISSLKPDKQETPRLKSISSSSHSFNDITFFCYADGEAIFTAKGFESILLLLSLYYVLNIAFPPDSRLQFSLLSFLVLKKAAVKYVKKDVLKLVSFTNALTHCGVN